MQYLLGLSNSITYHTAQIGHMLKEGAETFLFLSSNYVVRDRLKPPVGALHNAFHVVGNFNCFSPRIGRSVQRGVYGLNPCYFRQWTRRGDAKHGDKEICSLH